LTPQVGFESSEMCGRVGVLIPLCLKLDLHRGRNVDHIGVI